MIEDDFFETWLADEANKVKGKFQKGENLSSNDMQVLILKGLTNHYHHLEIDLKTSINETNERMTATSKEINDRITATSKEINDRVTATNDRVTATSKEINDRVTATSKEINEKMTDGFIALHKALNNQTWKMIGFVGLIVLLGKILEISPELIQMLQLYAK